MKKATAFLNYLSDFVLATVLLGILTFTFLFTVGLGPESLPGLGVLGSSSESNLTLSPHTNSPLVNFVQTETADLKAVVSFAQLKEDLTIPVLSIENLSDKQETFTVELKMSAQLQKQLNLTYKLGDVHYPVIVNNKDVFAPIIELTVDSGTKVEFSVDLDSKTALLYPQEFSLLFKQ